MTDPVTGVYLHVVDDVIKNVREEFQTEGVDDSVLQELQALWELKLVQAGAIAGQAQEEEDDEAELPAEAPGTAAPLGGHDLNEPYEGDEEDELLATRDLFAAARPVPPQAYVQDPQEDNAAALADEDLEPTLGRPKPFLPKPEHWDIKPSVDLNSSLMGEDEDGNGIAQDFISADRNKRLKTEGDYGFISQLDGAADAGPSTWQLRSDGTAQSGEESVPQRIVGGAGRPIISQAGGGHEDEDFEYDEDDGAEGGAELREADAEAEEEEDYNEPGDQADVGQTASAAATTTPQEDQNEEELGSGDDEDDDEDLNDGENDTDTNNIVLATYDKVTHVKSKWKCVLRDGIMNLNGKDILFTKANGEFEFDRKVS